MASTPLPPSRFQRLFGAITVLPVAVLLCCSLTSQGYSQEQQNRAADELLLLLQTDRMVNEEREQLAKLEYITIPRRTSDEIRKAMAIKKAELFEQVFKDFTWETLQPHFVRIYAETFSEEELNEMIAFYKSPVGRKLIEKTPEVQGKIIEVLKRKGTPMIAEMRQAASDALQASFSEASSPVADSNAESPTKPEARPVDPQ